MKITFIASIKSTSIFNIYFYICVFYTMLMFNDFEKVNLSKKLVSYLLTNTSIY